MNSYIKKLNFIKYLNKNNVKKGFELILQSISGKDQDYTSLKLSKAVVLLSIPMVLELVMESIFSIVDVYFVSKIGPDAVAAVGLTESLLSILYSICFGLAIAANAIISRRVGAKELKEAANSTYQAIFAGIAVSIPISIVGIFYSKNLLELLGASAQVINEYSSYTVIMIGCNIVIMLLFIINAVFRSAGDASISMKILWIANLINIVLDPILIFGLGPIPALGVTGAAIATVFGRGIAVIIQMYYLFFRKSKIVLKIKDIKIDFKIIFSILKLSLGSISQNIIASASWVGLVMIIAQYGSVVIAGYTIAIRILLFVLLPVNGLANASATLVGQNLGAKNIERAENAVWKTIKFGLVFFILISIFLFYFSETLVAFFINDILVIDVGTYCLKVISIGFLSYCLGTILIVSINGAGDTFTPTIVNIIIFWCIEIPLAYILANIFDFQEKGVFYAILISETLLTITSLIVFKKGKWKTKNI